MNKQVSIALCTYNGEKYILEQLDSILNQTYKPIEIIIVDDCSSDNTVQIIQEYQQKYSLIKLYCNSFNLGIVKSFNRALSLCGGDYVALSDQDDIWFPNKIEELINNIGDNLLIHSDSILIDNSMNIISPSHFLSAKKFKDKSHFIDYLISNNVTGCTVMVSKQLLTLALPIPENFYIHDHYLALIASFYGKLKFLDKPLLYYRQHSQNTIGAYRTNFEEFLLACKVKAESYNVLLSTNVFKGNTLIELLRDYRLSIYLGKWKSKFSILKIFTLKHGFKLFVYYILMVSCRKHNISKKIYNYFYRKNLARK
jgi:glycosyltransferase involved in cell wall biosynthesis